MKWSQIRAAALRLKAARCRGLYFTSEGPRTVLPIGAAGSLVSPCKALQMKSSRCRLAVPRASGAACGFRGRVFQIFSPRKSLWWGGNGEREPQAVKGVLVRRCEGGICVSIHPSEPSAARV